NDFIAASSGRGVLRSNGRNALRGQRSHSRSGARRFERGASAHLAAQHICPNLGQLRIELRVFGHPGILLNLPCPLTAHSPPTKISKTTPIVSDPRWAILAKLRTRGQNPVHRLATNVRFAVYA